MLLVQKGSTKGLSGISLTNCFNRVYLGNARNEGSNPSLSSKNIRARYFSGLLCMFNIHSTNSAILIAEHPCQIKILDIFIGTKTHQTTIFGLI
jgi:hypothetical protein